MIPFITNKERFTFYLDGEAVTVEKSHPRAGSIRTAIKDGDLESLKLLIQGGLPTTVEAIVNEDLAGVVEIKDGVVYYEGEALHNRLAEIMVELKQDGFNMDNYVKFLKNLMQNPSFNSRQQLYSFMEDHNLPITEDGCILAYKGVTDEYMDCHTQTFDNSPGAVHEMPREKVDDNPNNACSSGFHVGSEDYALRFGSQTMIVKVNPRDVVAVPTRETAKCRCCRYEVLSLYKDTLNRVCYAEDGSNLIEDFKGAFVEGDSIIFDYKNETRSIFITGFGESTVSGELLPDDKSYSPYDTRYRCFDIEEMEAIDFV